MYGLCVDYVAAASVTLLAALLTSFPHHEDSSNPERQLIILS